MSEQRIEALKGRHSKLDDRIHEEQSRPAPDTTAVREMKADKLAMKDEITRLSS
jgi:hypothetical protein